MKKTGNDEPRAILTPDRSERPPGQPLRIGITLGDPTGIGPELFLKTLSDPRLVREAARRLAVPVKLRLYGDAGVLRRTAASLGLSALCDALLAMPELELRAVTELADDAIRPGQPSAASGAAQVAYLRAAIADAVAGELAGLCTGPIHKASAHAAGLRFPGHTELLADSLSAGGQVVMMLACPRLRVALCTTHIALHAVPAALSVEGIRQVIETTALALHHDFGIAAPRLWVAGLNPHAGEAGHFGDEEARLIEPAMAEARALPSLRALPGLELRGPLPPDTLFHAALHLEPTLRPDAVIAMYHDQGLIPLKLVGFDDAVNVTLGLRIVRTSPDHGVAHDIAGRGIARPGSLQAALAMCLSVAATRRDAGTGAGS